VISKIPAAIPAEKMVRNALGLCVVIGDGALKGAIGTVADKTISLWFRLH
jgi:hypothetical protein